MLGRRLVCNQTASSDACIKDRRWHTVSSMLVSICVGINKQSSYTLAFMLQVKAFDTKVITGRYFIKLQVCLARLMKLDTLPPFFYYELLFISREDHQ